VWYSPAEITFASLKYSDPPSFGLQAKNVSVKKRRDKIILE